MPFGSNEAALFKNVNASAITQVQAAGNFNRAAYNSSKTFFFLFPKTYTNRYTLRRPPKSNVNNSWIDKNSRLLCVIIAEDEKKSTILINHRPANKKTETTHDHPGSEKLMLAVTRSDHEHLKVKLSANKWNCTSGKTDNFTSNKEINSILQRYLLPKTIASDVSSVIVHPTLNICETTE